MVWCNLFQCENESHAPPKVNVSFRNFEFLEGSVIIENIMLPLVFSFIDMHDLKLL